MTRVSNRVTRKSTSVLTDVCGLGTLLQSSICGILQEGSDTRIREF